MREEEIRDDVEILRRFSRGKSLKVKQACSKLIEVLISAIYENPLGY